MSLTEFLRTLWVEECNRLTKNLHHAQVALVSLQNNITEQSLASTSASENLPASDGTTNRILSPRGKRRKREKL